MTTPGPVPTNCWPSRGWIWERTRYVPGAMQNTVPAGLVAASASRSAPGATATPVHGAGAGQAAVVAVSDAAGETLRAAS